MGELTGVRSGGAGLWAVDRVMISYLAAIGILIALFRDRVPGSTELLGWHALGIAALFATARLSGRFPALLWFRYLYPVLYIAACYREMSLLIRALRGIDYDTAMAHWDIVLCGARPAVLLSGIQTPWLTEALQVIYSLFLPALVIGAVLLATRRQWSELRYYVFAITLGFLVSYVGYLLVPVRGPRFHLPPQTPPLEGLWLYNSLRAGLDWLESAHYDCFPSGHVQLTMMATWLNRKRFPVLFLIFFPYTMAVAFATVYLQYHYMIDVIAGALVAVVLLWVGPRLYIMLGRAH